MKPFWSLLAKHWPLSMPRTHLEALIGLDRVAGLVAAGLLEGLALQDGETVPCHCCGGSARLVDEGEEMVAACTGTFACPVEHLGRSPERLRVEPIAFARIVQGTLDIDGLLGEPAPIVPLGRRALGDQTVAFDLVGRPGRIGLVDALYRLARGGPSVRVLLVPDGHRLPADMPSELGGVDLLWVGLNELLLIEDGVRADLRALTRHRTFPGFAVPVTEPPPPPAAPARTPVLEIGPDHVWWASQKISLNVQALRLLRILAEHPGEVVPKVQLRAAVWAEEHTRGGQLPRGANSDHFDARLRRVAAELREALGDDALEVRRGNEREGGYRLHLPV